MSVFNDLYANQYDTLYTTKDYVGECDLIEASVKRFGSVPNSVLDIGCGTGSHVVEFARRGYNCTGVDLSQAMLDVAARKTASEDLKYAPQWIQGDARNFDAGGPYDLATMMFAVISYLTSNEDVINGLKNIRKHLRTGSIFICDFWYGPAVLSVKPNERVRVLETPKGSTIRAASTTVDTFNHTADVNFRLWTIEHDRYIGETSETHRMRYFFPQEFAQLLELAGFRPLSFSAFPNLDEPLTVETWNAFSVSEAI
jgi:SAM-dependent methyltransferase